MSYRLKYLLQMRYGEALTSDARETGSVLVYGSNGPIGEHNLRNMRSPAIVIGRKGSHGKVSWAPNGGFCIDTALYVDESSCKSDLRYAYYLLQTLGLEEPSKDSAVPGLDRFEAHNKIVRAVGIEAQKAIADFLDRETARIDLLIEKKSYFLALLEQEFQSFITNAVTVGLSSKRELRDSGYKWHPRIPVNWTATRLKFLCLRIVDCLHETPDHSDKGEYPSIRTADVKRGLVDFQNVKRISRQQYEHRIQRLRPQEGDVLYTREGERFGLAAIVPANVEICLGQRMMMFRTNELVLPRYLMWSLNSEFAYNFLKQTTFGATSPHLNIFDIRNTPIYLPPKEQQYTIVKNIDMKFEKKERLSALVSQTITRLREFRAALITAAVTGQINVETWGKRGQTDRRLDKIEEAMQA